MKLIQPLGWMLPLSFGLGLFAQAGGSKPPGGAQPTPAPVVANPVRMVIVKPVQTRVFTLPNGAQADLQKDLDAIFQTVVTETPVFAPFEPAPDLEKCATQIEIRPVVSTFQMDVSELDLRFGYSPAGVNNPLQQATGELNVNVGVIGMDFSVWECTRGSCHSVTASTSDQNATTVKGKFKINFGTITGGGDFVHHPVVQQIVREIMTDAMKKITSSVRLSELSWRAHVRETSRENGTVLLDQGANSRVGVNQQFVVYSPVDSAGLCEVVKPVAYIRTTQVDTVTSFGVIDQLLDSRGILPGDVIMIRPR